MFYIESDSDFESDRLALVEISKILARWGLPNSTLYFKIHFSIVAYISITKNSSIYQLINSYHPAYNTRHHRRLHPPAPQLFHHSIPAPHRSLSSFSHSGTCLSTPLCFSFSTWIPQSPLAPLTFISCWLCLQSGLQRKTQSPTLARSAGPRNNIWSKSLSLFASAHFTTVSVPPFFGRLHQIFMRSSLQGISFPAPVHFA